MGHRMTAKENETSSPVTLYILTSVCIFSTLSLYISQGAYKENLFVNQKLPSLVTISFILMTLMCNSGVIL